MSEDASTKSEDIGTLVLLLSDHAFQEYDPDIENEDRDCIEYHFSDLEYLTHHARNQHSFTNRLPGFVRRLELMSSGVQSQCQHTVNGQGFLAKLLLIPALASYTYGTYSIIKHGFENPVWRELFLGAMALCGTGIYVLGKRRKNRAFLDKLKSFPDIRKSPDEEWRKAFCAYTRHFTDIIDEFKDYKAQKI